MCVGKALTSDGSGNTGVKYGWLEVPPKKNKKNEAQTRTRHFDGVQVTLMRLRLQEHQQIITSVVHGLTWDW